MKKKRFLALLLLVLLAAAGILLRRDMIAEEETVHAELDSYSLNLPSVFEYSKDTIDQHDYLSSQIDTLSHEINVSGLEEDTLQDLGTRNVAVTLSTEDKYKRQYQKTLRGVYCVSDTQHPVITLNDSEISITEGNELDLEECVGDVSDPVDGPLAYSEEKLPGTYWFEGEADTDTPGSYEIQVIAKDLNGNETRESISVEVKKKPVIRNTPSGYASAEGRTVNFDAAFPFVDAPDGTEQGYINSGYITRFYGDYFHHNTSGFLNMFWQCTAGTTVIIGGTTYTSGGIYHGWCTDTDLYYDDDSPSWYANGVTELITCDGPLGTNKRWILVLY